MVFAGALAAEQSDEDLIKRAVLPFSVYRSVLLHAHAPACTAAAACQALPQFAREAVRYHARSRRCVGQWLLPAGRGPTHGRGEQEAEVDAAGAGDDGPDAIDLMQ